MIVIHPRILLFFVIISIIYLLWRKRYAGLYQTLKATDGKPEKGYVYFVSDIGQLLPSVKIGFSVDARTRLSHFKTSCPMGLIVWLIIPVKDMNAVERAFHSRYSIYRIRKNREYFWLMPKIWFDIIQLKPLSVSEEKAVRKKSKTS